MIFARMTPSDRRDLRTPSRHHLRRRVSASSPMLREFGGPSAHLRVIPPSRGGRSPTPPPALASTARSTPRLRRGCAPVEGFPCATLPAGLPCLRPSGTDARHGRRQLLHVSPTSAWPEGMRVRTGSRSGADSRARAPAGGGRDSTSPRRGGAATAAPSSRRRLSRTRRGWPWRAIAGLAAACGRGGGSARGHGGELPLRSRRRRLPTDRARRVRSLRGAWRGGGGVACAAVRWQRAPAGLGAAVGMRPASGMRAPAAGLGRRGGGHTMAGWGRRFCSRHGGQ
ncbi:hypothetical protein PVAP13_3NG079525 [Panicum virgatum]|uniref:Uncharacterized protein n=1 Tax=Panicum virgatum TaxID=38727 RepID=A0A8T0U1D8_PANVG|nr:hypothetical protein PVAP13_3NG079525 [Panicum virgatum]